MYVWEKAERKDVPRDANLVRAAQVYGTTPEALRGLAEAPEKTTRITVDKVANAPSANASSTTVPPKRKRGRPRTRDVAAPSTGPDASPSTANNGTTSVALMAPGRAGRAVVSDARGASLNAVPRSVYGRVFRALADLADNSSLGIEELAAAQVALTSPNLLGTFSSLSADPMSEADMLAAIDASASAVRMFVANRHQSNR